MKFKKGDKVIINLGAMFTNTFGGPIDNSTSEPTIITDCRIYNGNNQYKVKGYVGWWNETALTKIY